MNRFVVILCLFMVSCSLFPKKNKAKESYASNLSDLELKYLNYRIYTVESWDDDGWILADECDALLHTSLLAAAKGTNYDNLYDAREEDGQWHRTPAKDCLSTGRSKSTISRDMLLALLIPVAYFKLEDTAEKLLDYADEHDFVMGESDGSLDGQNRVALTPSLYSLIKDVWHYTKGSLDSRPEDESSDDPFEDDSKLVDFTDHLDALAIEIKGTIYGGLTDFELSLMDKLRKEDPNNALYQAIYRKYKNGDQDKAVSILLREDLFPSDRLPSVRERCAPYLWMHGEKDKDWKPCKGKTKHPGHDFLFAARIILGPSL